jgi:2-succinyl-6-hydroxy-2,4-cyclohexadiene-1-carboxylate synthase
VAQNVAWVVTLTLPSEQIGHTGPVPLHAERDGSGPRLVLVHGFAQTRNCWGRAAQDLAADHEVVRIDAPGHGRSHAVRADPWDAADLLVEAGGEATYVGYSMGARLVLHAAVAHPEAVRGLVLVGATAGIDDPAARRARVERDEELARRLERDGVAAFVDDWLAQPLFAGLPDDARFVHERRTNTAAGLAAGLRLAGTGAQEPLWDRLAGIDAPTLVTAGEDDAKFAAEARRLVDAIGANATVVLVPGAGHSAHLERPDAWLAVVRPWLATHETPARARGRSVVGPL